MECKITHGRKGQPNEFLEIKLQKPKLNVVVQKTGDDWIAYLVGPQKDGAVRTFGHFETSEDARFAIEIIAQAIVAYNTL